MQNGNYFFLIFSLAILITRIILSPRRVHSPTIWGFRLHHYEYGIVFIAVSLIISNLTLYAIGAGLFVDELPQLLTGNIAYDWNIYYSKKMILGVLLFAILVFIFRNYLLLPFK